MVLNFTLRELNLRWVWKIGEQFWSVLMKLSFQYCPCYLKIDLEWEWQPPPLPSPQGKRKPLFSVGIYGKLNVVNSSVNKFLKSVLNCCKGLNFQNYRTVNKWIVKYCLRILHCKVQCLLFDYYDGKVDKLNLNNLSISVNWSLKE